MLYTVQPGDTLYKVAASYTLSPSYAVGLAQANGLMESEGVPLNPAVDLSLYAGTLEVPYSWLKPKFKI